MKKLLLIFLCVLAVQAGASQDEDHKSSFVYSYGIKPFFDLEQFVAENINLSITSCAVLKNDSFSEEEQKYKDLGSCILHSGVMLMGGEHPQTRIRVHFSNKQAENSSLTAEWTPVTLAGLWASYQDQKPIEFFLSISLEKPRFLDDWLKGLLLDKLQTLVEGMLQNEDQSFSKSRIHRIQFRSSPLSDKAMDLEITLFNFQNREVYKYSVVTNYHFGAEEFFVVSKDQYDEFEQTSI